ncbi:hypothetical protein AVEN_275724-1 [Araneus ventricosus]|uniref:DDE-1 domain-containing protein n=1 Tax=Araneus ventricosus TaxID=182803 RepID=A0A4Y2SVE7_ARAVE|nr:hypothetical protein AVEN_275724-1 [Araneus ventricosus]
MMCWCSKKAWATRDLFIDWIAEVLSPLVKKYLIQMNLQLHAHNAERFCRSTDLQDFLLIEIKFIKIQFLPPNITQLLQPMDRRVISNLKKFYTKALFGALLLGD